RTYTLAADVYQAEGDKAAYTRQLGFSNLQHEQLVLNYVRQHGSIQRGEVAELCRISDRQAKVLLARLKTSGRLILDGLGRGAAYRLTDAETDE
ncbi:MAG: AAA family ATPase, partial [Burkholderiaceae bacterium]